MFLNHIGGRVYCARLSRLWGRCDAQGLAIIGAGALGKCLAALLADQSAVAVYERNPVTSRALMKGALILKEKECTHKGKVRVVESLSQLQGTKIDVLIFATKIMDLRQAVGKAAGLDVRCVFFPQNGIFDIRWTKGFFKAADICRGVTTMACQETGLCQVTLFYRGDMYVGGDGAMRVAGIFRACGSGPKHAVILTGLFGQNLFLAR